MLRSISPIDGRYALTTRSLQEYFSEYALIRYRVLVEIEYFKTLASDDLPQLSGARDHIQILEDVLNHFNEVEAQKIKEIEKITNHDVKAVEYYLKEKIQDTPLYPFHEFIHFGLTSQDVNNTAQPLALKNANETILFPLLDKLIIHLDRLAGEWMNTPMLAHTHGQPASPTTIGKEIKVFVERLISQLGQLKQVPITAKFGGATGNLNAHYTAYPDRNWHLWADHFVSSLGLQRIPWTTQIEPYDQLANWCHTLSRINTILIDFCRDIWMYISMQYIKQKAVPNEVGSSAMPHKVNPIDFENAEGNLGIANALLTHFAEKLPISRLQRDLTDSTVLRNLGVPIGHVMISVNSLLKGLGKIDLNEPVIHKALDANWAVVAEAIQTILRREGIDQSYELLKELTRGKSEIIEKDIKEFIKNLPVSDHIKKELNRISPFNYVGKTPAV